MHNEVPPPPNLRGRGRGGNIRGRGRGRGFGGANHGGYMNASKDSDPGWSPWVPWGGGGEGMGGGGRGRAAPPSGPSDPVCSFPGAGYGSYGYGGNSATAGYSKCVFLLV